MFRSTKTLVVDDESNISCLCSDAPSTAGAEATEVKNGHNSIEHIAKADFELGIKDIHLPKGVYHLPTFERQHQLIRSKREVENFYREIAHDFNNLLNIIMGNIELTIANVPERSQIRINLEEILKASERAQDLVQEILTSRNRKNNYLQPLEVQSVVKDALKIVRTSLPTNIEMHENICNGSSLVLADYSKLHRVIMNLCTNACHAMEQDGGELSVTLAEVQFGPANSFNTNINAGYYVCLSVSDTGHGIEKEIMDRIFDPYFSTKKKDNGTGLGLYIVNQIVHRYGGNIKVESELGEGTVFDVYLPRLYQKRGGHL